MATNAQIMAGALAWMANHRGLTEHPPGSNIVPLDGSTLWRHLRPEYEGGAWCAASCVYAYLQQGVDLRKIIDNPFYCPDIEEYAKQIGAWDTSDHNVGGDLVLYDTSGAGIATHVGMAAPDSSDYSGYRAWEGNTSWGNGSQSDGGVLCRRDRPRSMIRGWVRMDKVLTHMREKGLIAGSAPAAPAKPAAKAPAAPASNKPTISLSKLKSEVASGKSGPTVKVVQDLLNRSANARAAGVPNLVLDGVWGPSTRTVFRAFQHLLDEHGHLGWLATDCDGYPGEYSTKALAGWRGSATYQN